MIRKPSVLERVLRPFEGNIPPDFARQILTTQFTDAEQTRYRELSAKIQSAPLTEEERAELDDLLTANDVLTILHAKAKKSLARTSSAA